MYSNSLTRLFLGSAGQFKLKVYLILIKESSLYKVRYKLYMIFNKQQITFKFKFTHGIDNKPSILKGSHCWFLQTYVTVYVRPSRFDRRPIFGDVFT